MHLSSYPLYHTDFGIPGDEEIDIKYLPKFLEWLKNMLFFFNNLTETAYIALNYSNHLKLDYLQKIVQLDITGVEQTITQIQILHKKGVKCSLVVG